MSVLRKLSYRRRHGIGFRLSLVLLFVVGFFLLALALGIDALFNLSRGYKDISGVHFERAMRAAELTRDAEVIAAQALESLLSSDRTASNESAVDRDLVQVFETSREKFYRSVGHDNEFLREFERLQKPYFESLYLLDQRIAEDRRLKEIKQKYLQQLSFLLQELPTHYPNDAEANQLQQYVLQIIGSASLALNSEKQGELNQLKTYTNVSLDKLRASPHSATQQALLMRLDNLTQSLFLTVERAIQGQRATLAVARQARLNAQRLTSSSYNHFLALKGTARAAAQEHQQSVISTLKQISVVSGCVLLVVLLSVIYVRRQVLNRLNDLSETMVAHVDGGNPPIPQAGNDEISVMGQVFSVFVRARQQAEAELTAAKLEADRANTRLREANRSLQQLSEVDPLTQIANRRAFDSRLSEVWQRAARLQHSVALLMIDLDYFKRYNDSYGHPQGDSCLRQVATILQQELKTEGQLVARYGGEEFMVLLPDTGLTGAQTIGQRLLLAVMNQEIEHRQNPKGVMTLSIGASAMVPGGDEGAAVLMQRADDALYRAKENGRCRLELLADSVSLPE